ncbi:hypothetical protein VHEMI07345 [[Torrubiella] hemipterigena]|uniref:Glucose-methanol-choline oxidoreductase N-terminal domain-containing protein n=1 Tax=[Torrubiella] hemipterigena TaxID=1531966 RepID=A0A0A1TA30_9HYPO|nr:hypothetical protein VHEMI07345 [[Torrubiella] hemipterigena]
MGRQGNPLTNPLHYAAKQRNYGAPVATADAERSLPSYDYVIIGGGAAGSVLAGKLSEDPTVTVLVLEAGASNDKIFETKAPLLFGKLFHGEHDWNYYTTQQEGVANRELYWPRGRMLGGSSSMNAMMYHHCSKSDFDEWKDKFGCEGWSYDDIAPYFRRMEKFTPNPDRPAVNMIHRGTEGEWQTGYAHLNPIIEKGWIPGCEQTGIPYNEDINTPNGSLGVTRFQTFIDPKGTRSSMATAYLNSKVQQRRNLFVATGAHVTRILHDLVSAEKPKAIGVEFQTSKTSDKYEVHAKREVILCGGAINTPQILKLSGIGPAEELRRHHIGVVYENNAVGENLKDHFCSTGIHAKSKPGLSMDYLKDDIKAIPALAQWLLTGKGPLTSNVGESAAFVRSTEMKFDATTKGNEPKDHGSGGVGPDIEFIAAALGYIHHGEEPGIPGEELFSFVPIGLRPQSKGTVTLRSNDPFEHPNIDPKYWTDEGDNDRKVLLAGIRKGFDIIRSPAMKEQLETVPTSDDQNNYWWPYCSSNYDAITDEQLLRWMKTKAFTLYHPVGSARMGPSPKDSVVDLQCKVHGVDNLRIMDASVFPEQISGHPTAPIGAMAYKLSDMIKEGN